MVPFGVLLSSAGREKMRARAVGRGGALYFLILVWIFVLSTSFSYQCLNHPNDTDFFFFSFHRQAKGKRESVSEVCEAIAPN